MDALALVCPAPIGLTLAPATGSAEQPQLEIGVLTCSLAEGAEDTNAADVTTGSE